MFRELIDGIRDRCSRLCSLFRHRALERELEEEIQTHLEMEAEARRECGMPSQEARFAALRAFGGVDQIKESVRDDRSFAWIEHLGRDLRFAARMINRNRCFSAAVIGTLALGIGISTTAFTVLDATLFRPIGIPGGQRLVRVMNQQRTTPDDLTGISYADFLEYRHQNSSLEGIEAAMIDGGVISGRNEAAEHLRLGRVSAGMFGLLHTAPVIGRDFVAADELPGAPLVALIADSVWERRYARSPDVVGRIVRISGTPAAIVGVMPKSFEFPQNQECWVPLPRLVGRDSADKNLQLFGIVRATVPIESAAADLSLIASRLATQYPETNRDTSVVIRTFQDAYNGEQVRDILFILFGAAACVLLIACANVANLMLSRAMTRSRELSMRVALGASRAQVVRQMLVESLLLSSIGGLFGLVLASVGIHFFDRAVQNVGKPYWIVLNFDTATFFYVAAVSIGSGLIFGVAPALRATRIDLSRALKDDTSGTGARRGGRLTALLVVAQFALTLVLLATAGMMIRSFIAAQSVNPFVPGDSILTAQIRLGVGKDERYATPESRRRFCDELLHKISAVPGVTHAALASDLPALGAGQQEIEIEGSQTGEASRFRASFVSQSSGYLPLIAMPLLEGRSLSDADQSATESVAVVSHSFASTHWPERSAIGHRFRFVIDQKAGRWISVVGVCADMVQEIGTSSHPPLVFLPYRDQPPDRLSLLLRTSFPPSSLTSAVRSAVQSLDPDLPISSPQTLASAVRDASWFLSVFGTMFSAFAATGLVMAAVGVYGVVAQVTTRRTREIGIRIALGASVRSVLRLVMSRGLTQLLVGFALGLVGAFGATQLLVQTGLLYRATPNDPVVVAATSALMLGIGALACLIPARRAATLKPMVALRCD